VRFGRQVFSPMVPAGEADYLLVLDAAQVEVHRHMVRSGGVVIAPDAVDAGRLSSRKELNVALLGVLSVHLPVGEGDWLAVLRERFGPESFEANRAAFLHGRACDAPAHTSG
ncbi:MAG TPA: pyruvate ferredoxin oxidoreductase, partial [Verrucomicrobiota bacterium]|nr:pyruvate ferredoxin oxidoreductase [Verrucomicrobiota bacterium]